MLSIAQEKYDFSFTPRVAIKGKVEEGKFAFGEFRE